VKYAYLNLKEAYEAKKDYPAANIILNKLMEVKDSLRNIENANQIAELETKFKTKEKEIELSEVKLIQQLRDKENSEQLKRKNYLHRSAYYHWRFNRTNWNFTIEAFY
jgi:hypothetical protein